MLMARRMMRQERAHVDVPRCLSRQLERAVHREGKVLSERREQQWTIVLDPIVRATIHELRDCPLACLERVRRFQVFVREPFLVVPASRWRACACLLCGHPEEQVDGCLFVVICADMRVMADDNMYESAVPRSEFA